LKFQVEKSARPQAKLLAIDIDCEVAPSAVLPGAALAAVDHTLANLGHVQVDGDAFLSPFITKAAPVACQSRAGPNVASVRIFGCGILRPNRHAQTDHDKKYRRDNNCRLFHRCYSCDLFFDGLLLTSNHLPLVTRPSTLRLLRTKQLNLKTQPEVCRLT